MTKKTRHCRLSDNCLFCCLDVLVEQIAKYKEQFVQAVQEVGLYKFGIILLVHVFKFISKLYGDPVFL